MRRIRERLFLPSFDAVAAVELMTASEELATYAVQRLCPCMGMLKVDSTVKAYGLRFIILSLLQPATEAIGQPLPFWWPQFMDAVLKGCKLDGSLSWSSPVLALYRFGAGSDCGTAAVRERRLPITRTGD